MSKFYSSQKYKLYETFHKDRRLQKRIIDENNFTYKEILKTIRPYIKTSKKVLDIGSGVGTIDFYLASKGINTTGIEISQKAVALAKVNSRFLGLDKKTKFISANFSNYKSKEKFDLVILSEVIEHLENEKEILFKIKNFMNKNSVLIITTPSQKAPLYKLGLLKQFDLNVGHIRRYTTESLKDLLEKNGFKVIHISKHEGILRNFLFTNPVAGRLVRIIRWQIGDLVSFMDNLTIPLLGESNIHIIAKVLKD